MPTFETRVDPHLLDLHDPNGPDLQVHEMEDETVLTLSDDLAASIDWRPGDTVVWEIEDGRVTVTNRTRDLRQKVDDLLDGGPTL